MAWGFQLALLSGLYLTIVRGMDDVSIIRRFNRTVTQRIGALENHFLGRGRSLGASRVLFEVGEKGMQIRDLRVRLGFDSGYTSRLLRGLEKDGLIRVDRSAEDSRVRFVTLSAAGLGELAVLNRLSDEGAASILEPLSEKQRSALVEAMAAVERLLGASSVSMRVEDPSSRIAQQCLQSYYSELAERFDHGFDPALSISAKPEELAPPNGYFVVASLHGEGIGCGALKCHADFGEVKRMWVASERRGLGIGRRVLGRLEELARERRLRVLRLETNKALVEAQALYRRSGYKEVAPFNSEPYAHHWFEKTL
jgi:DNA-binding MarR family transcriptional regulator/GNAT superfamily N-acetyltransferase